MSSWCEIILIRCWIGIRGDHLRNKIIWKFFLKFWKIQWKIKTFTNLLRQTSFVAKTFAKLADFTGHRANQCFERVSCEVSSLLYQPKIWAKDSQKSFLLNADGNKKIFWIGWLPKTSVKILEMERNGEKSRISNFLVMNDAECECIVGRWSNQNRIFPGIVLLRKNSFQLKIPKSVVGNRY